MKLISFGLLFLALISGSAALSQTSAGTAAKKKPAPKSASSTTSAGKKAPAKKGAGTVASTATQKPGTAAAATSRSKTSKTGRKTAVAAAPARYRQMQPTPERYKEIQQALIDKGYLKHEATGVWDQDSISALQQFQTDQKLSPTGKISSASLINLGLGPKISTDPISPPAPSAPNP